MIPLPPLSTLFPYTTLFRSTVVPLTIIHARTVGLMTMIDSGKKDHKIIAVATEDPEFNSYREASEMPSHRSLMLRSEEHTSELQSHSDLVCRLLLEKKKKTN